MHLVFLSTLCLWADALRFKENVRDSEDAESESCRCYDGFKVKVDNMVADEKTIGPAEFASLRDALAACITDTLEINSCGQSALAHGRARIGLLHAKEELIKANLTTGSEEVEGGSNNDECCDIVKNGAQKKSICRNWGMKKGGTCEACWDHTKFETKCSSTSCTCKKKVGNKLSSEALELVPNLECCPGVTQSECDAGRVIVLFKTQDPVGHKFRHLHENCVTKPDECLCLLKEDTQAQLILQDPALQGEELTAARVSLDVALLKKEGDFCTAKGQQDFGNTLRGEICKFKKASTSPIQISDLLLHDMLWVRDTTKYMCKDIGSLIDLSCWR